MQLQRARPDFEAAGALLVFIGQATPRHAAHFRGRWGIESPVLADERRESYRMAGAKVATTSELLGPDALIRNLATTVGSRGKVRQGRIIGHAAQLGGAMVVSPDGAVAWAHMSDYPSDNASPEDILEAVRRTAAPA